MTVVVPTRNRSLLLQTTLAGILASRDVDLEVVVVDDGSTDDTQRCIAALEDPRIRVLHHDESRGVVTARNAGAEVADGTWLGFCDDDDLWAPTKLAAQLQAAELSDRRWVVTGAVGFEVDGTIRYVDNPPPGPEVTALLPWRNRVPGGCSNVVVRRDLLRDAGAFDPRLRVLADWELWIRLSRREPPATVSSPLVGYRLHASNMSNDSRGVYAEFGLVEQLSQDLRGGLPIEPHWFHHWVAHAALRARRRRTAAVGYARAATLADPEPLLRSAAALMLPEQGWKQLRRLRAHMRPRPPVPPWLEALLARERQSQPE